MPEEKIVGWDSKFGEIWKRINKPRARIIGLCGIGGVGKSTLLKIIEKVVKEAGDSDLVVILVLVGKEGNVKTVQEDICKGLGIPMEMWKDKSEEERKEEICKILNKKRFFLLLDEIWGGDDLQEQSNSELWGQSHLFKIGVPVNDNKNGSKIIFTAQSEKVCGRMKYDEIIRVECLEPKEALELFMFYVGEHTLEAHPEIPKLAEVVAAKCQQLPLALKTVGLAMRGMTNPEDWRFVITDVEIHQSRLPDVRTKLFPVLKVSYDNLNSDTLKNCFIYFSIFREVHGIKKDELIDLWIGEGLLGEFDDICNARKKGEFIIGCLKRECVLESGESENSVKMHDMLHAMTLWLASEVEQTKSKVVVLKKPPKSKDWKNTERMSLWGPSIVSFTQIPHCDHLITLFVRETKLETFPSGRFEFMPALRVLDFSDNKDLCQLPSDIGRLINLHYLNLSQTSIEELPPGIEKLKNLEILLLNNTERLRNFPRKVLSGLRSLRTFSMLFDSSSSNYCLANEVGIIEELERLELIKEICIIVSSVIFVQTALPSPNLLSCIRKLILVGDPNSTWFCLKEILLRMKQIERLELWNFKSIMMFDGEVLQEIIHEYAPNCLPLNRQQCFNNLKLVSIWDCPIKNVTWLVYAPNLQVLEISECSEIEEVLSDDFGQEALSSLTELSLRGLPMLRHICYQTVLLPCLLKLIVNGCPRLQKLPFESNSAKNLKVITGEVSWWMSLKWKDDNLKHVFSSKYYWITQAMVLKVELHGANKNEKMKILEAMQTIGEMEGVLHVTLNRKGEFTVVGDFVPEDIARTIRGSIHAEILSVPNK